MSIGRTSLFPRALIVRVALTWIVVTAVLLGTCAGNIAHLRFPDPDDTLRLIQVRNLLAGQNWFDLHQYRVDPLDGGVLMHWSRLVDLPIAATILAFRPFAGEQHAELAALIVVPLITLLCMLLLIGRLAWRRIGLDSAALAGFIAVMSVKTVIQMLPMRIDHHGWQIVAALAGLCGLMSEDRRKGGWAAGVAMALGMAISIEGLPLAVAFAGIGAWRWLRGEGSVWLTRFLTALASTSILAFLGTRGLADLAEHCDAVSPVHLAAFTLSALTIAVLSRFRKLSVMALLAGFAATGAGALVLAVTMAPQCTHGAFAELDPVVHRIWLDNIEEGLPIWRQSWTVIFVVLVPGLAGTAIAGLRALRMAGEERRWWQDYVAALAAALTVACLVERASGTSCAFAALPLAWQVERWLHVARQAGWKQRVSCYAGTALMLVPILPIVIVSAAIGKLSGNTAQSAGNTADSSNISACAIRKRAPLLASFGNANLLAPVDIGPELLFDAPHATVLATGHHRGARAIREVIDTFTGTDAAAHAIVARRRIDYVALCPDLGEIAIYMHAAPQGLAAKLLAGRAPTWLRPLGPVKGGTLRIWQVIA